MQKTDNDAAAQLRADDLSIILDRLEGTSSLLADLKLARARDELGIVMGLACSAHLNAGWAVESTRSAGDRAHFDSLKRQADFLVRLTGNALRKVDRGSPAAARADLDSAIELVQEMVEAAQRFWGMPA